MSSLNSLSQRAATPGQHGRLRRELLNTVMAVWAGWKQSYSWRSAKFAPVLFGVKVKFARTGFLLSL
jgi:hypothetical protein